MNPHTQLIESLGWRWTGPWAHDAAAGPHYALSRVPKTDAVPDEVMVNTLILAGWTVMKAPFLGFSGHTFLWAYPPINL